MSNIVLPEFPAFEKIKEALSVERENYLKSESFGKAEEYIRADDDAEIILNFYQDYLNLVWKQITENPWCLDFFEKENIALKTLVDESYILDVCFVDDCLIPEKDLLYFGQDGGIDKNILMLHLDSLGKWFEDKIASHTLTQKFIREEFDEDRKVSELVCQCINCRSEFRTKLRKNLLEECLNEIDETEAKIVESQDKVSIDEVSSLYAIMSKSIEKKVFKFRYRLKKSSINKLQQQLKSVIKEKFNYPSDVAKNREALVRSSLMEFVYEEGMNEEFFDADAFKKFFKLIGPGIWKNKSFINREFKKFSRSILILKKKDISGKILQDYIGEFWIHSQARTIKRKIVYHMGPTNSGKTYHAIEKLASVDKGCYLAPLRLLAAELYDTLNNKDVKTSLLTGEEVIEVENATHYSSTIEMARLTEFFDCCVIDEIQMITDPQRGWAWTRALVNIFADEIHICGDPSVLELVEKIVELCGDELVIKKYDRMTNLVVDRSPVVLGELKKSDALIVFSRRNALRYKRDLEKLDFKVSIVYGRLSPEVRREQARKFDQGETDIMVSTDAIAMGMNLPIQRIVFSTLSKHIDSVEYPITDSEIKQIAGRAGRFKRFPTGHVSCLTKVEDGLEIVRDALSKTLDQRTKCMVGPDLDIYSQVNKALEDNGLSRLKLSEFLRLFNTMDFQKPFYCVELKEMIELAEMVEDADPEGRLSSPEVFGFACAPVNMGLISHIQYYTWILNKYVESSQIPNEKIDHFSNDIDYLETSIKCVELYQWLSRHFNNKNFYYDENDLLENKSLAVDKLNNLLSEKIVMTCSSCGVKLPENTKFNICDRCFSEKRFSRRRPPNFKRNKKSAGKKKFSKRKTGKKKVSIKRKSGNKKKRTR